MDFMKVFKDLKVEAKRVAKDVQLDKHIATGKDLSQDAIETLKTDRNAQIAATGGSALLMAVLLGTRGGRRFLGGAAKTGAVAALGALAYKAWQDRQGRALDDVKPEAVGFVIDRKMDPEFAEALVRTMVAAAWADNTLDAQEREAIDRALESSGTDLDARKLLTNEVPEDTMLELIGKAARSPNHAAQLYTAACVVTGDPNALEASFLSRLADKLGIEEGHASAIRYQVTAETS